PPITCGSRNTKPSVRNTLSRTNGSNACTYGCFDKRGTTYREAISVKESRLTVALTRNARNARFIDVLLNRGSSSCSACFHWFCQMQAPVWLSQVKGAHHSI